MFGLSKALAVTGKQPRVNSKEDPVTQETVARGHALFFLHCAECHGVDAKGTDDGPDLYNLHEGNALIRQVITGGVKREMPAFGKKLNDSDVQALIVYLRTLKRTI